VALLRQAADLIEQVEPDLSLDVDPLTSRVVERIHAQPVPAELPALILATCGGSEGPLDDEYRDVLENLNDS